MYIWLVLSIMDSLRFIAFMGARQGVSGQTIYLDQNSHISTIRSLCAAVNRLLDPLNVFMTKTKLFPFMLKALD